MTWQSFLYAADALRLEEGIGFHVETGPALVGPAPAPAPEEARAQNAESMKMLQGLLAPVQGAPGGRQPRRTRR